MIHGNNDQQDRIGGADPPAKLQYVHLHHADDTDEHHQPNGNEHLLAGIPQTMGMVLQSHNGHRLPYLPYLHHFPDQGDDKGKTGVQDRNADEPVYIHFIEKRGRTGHRTWCGNNKEGYDDDHPGSEGPRSDIADEQFF